VSRDVAAIIKGGDEKGEGWYCCFSDAIGFAEMH
jgi:hypothetical protein